MKTIREELTSLAAQALPLHTRLILLSAVDKIDFLEKVIEKWRERAKAEPVATVCKLANGQHDIAYKTTDLNNLSVGTKLYTHPPKQEQLNLNDKAVQKRLVVQWGYSLDKQEQSPKVAPTVAIDERAEFEKWANKHKGGEPLQLGGGGTYTNPFANAAYEAWQAARKLSAPEVVSKTTDTIVPDEKLLLEAIARGWCHEANSHKEVDASLVVAIAMEVKAMLKGAK